MFKPLVWLYLIAILGLSGCTSYGIEEGQRVAPEIWKKHGFEVVAYEGWQYGAPFSGGACVWHRLRKIPDNGITYSGFIQQWGNEWMVYGPTAIDAIRPGKGY